MTDVVIVGAGPAGTRCAERLAGHGVPVTLIGAEAGVPYNRVALSQLLAGDAEEDALNTHTAEALGGLVEERAELAGELRVGGVEGLAELKCQGLDGGLGEAHAEAQGGFAAEAGSGLELGEREAGCVGGQFKMGDGVGGGGAHCGEIPRVS